MISAAQYFDCILVNVGNAIKANCTCALIESTNSVSFITIYYHYQASL